MSFAGTTIIRGRGGEVPASLLPDSAIWRTDSKEIFQKSLSFAFDHTTARVGVLQLERLLEPHFQPLAVLVVVPGANHVPDTDGVCDLFEPPFHGIAPCVQLGGQALHLVVCAVGAGCEAALERVHTGTQRGVPVLLVDFGLHPIHALLQSHLQLSKALDDPLQLVLKDPFIQVRRRALK
jgi:hypothetical protein